MKHHNDSQSGLRKRSPKFLRLLVMLGITGFAAGLTQAAEAQFAGLPQAMSARQVEREFLEKPGAGKHGDVSAIIELFKQARTVRELYHLSSAALAALHDRGDPEAQKLRDLVYRTYNQVAPGGVNPTYTIGYEGEGLCDVDFN